MIETHNLTYLWGSDEAHELNNGRAAAPAAKIGVSLERKLMIVVTSNSGDDTVVSRCTIRESWGASWNKVAPVDLIESMKCQKYAKTPRIPIKICGLLRSLYLFMLSIQVD